MPKAPRRCPAKGCTTLIRHTRYCDDHTPAWDTPSGWTPPPGWDRTRRQVLQRDSYRCHVCGGDGADTVDHLRPVAQGGSHDPTNLAAIHDRVAPHCHRAKTNRDRRQPHRPHQGRR